MSATSRPTELSTPSDAVTASAVTRAEVHLGRLVQNLDVFRRTAPESDVMAVVKADAYGHGAPRVAATLEDAGVSWFAVATVPEGINLRKSGISGRILVFSAPLQEFIPLYREYDLDITVSSAEIAEYLVGPEQAPVRAHVKIETGMNRIGIPLWDAPRVIRMLETSGKVAIEGLWTHLATADSPDPDFSRHQIERFHDAIAPLRDSAAHVHIANSAAVLRLPESVRFPRAMMRIGIGLYGYSSLAGLAEEAGLTPIMTLTSRVTHLKRIERGATVSYGRRWRTERPTWIATVGAGYADGYPRLLSNRGDVSIDGVRYPIAGTVCMDMFMVDIGTGEHPSVGDEVVLFGPAGPDAFAVAEWAKTIPYEILTGITARVPRGFVS